MGLKDAAKRLMEAAGVPVVPGYHGPDQDPARLARGHGSVAGESLSAACVAERQIRQHQARARVLLVEDDPINREVALELLRSVGLAVDTAEDGLDALAKLRINAYDLILMDMQMPVMDGIEATLAIRASAASGRLPIVAMTANAFADDRERCLAAGMNDFIVKPVEPAVLYGTLSKWLPTHEEHEPDSPTATT